MRRIAIGAVGTRGDVMPAIALGTVLGRSNEVLLVAPPENRAEAERRGLRFLPLGEDFSGVVASGSLRNYRRQMRLQFSEHRAEFEGADAIIGFSLFYAGASLAEKSGAPHDQVFYTPQVFRSRSLPPPSSRDMRASTKKIEAAWRRHESQEDFILKALINEERKKLGLPAIRRASEARSPRRAILAVDDCIATIPTEVLGVRQAHYWRLPSVTELEGSVLDFLDAGSPPVLLSLGSVSRALPRSLLRLRKAAEALARAAFRVIIAHPDASERPTARGTILEARYCPFDALISRCSAIVHQGGIGTLFEAARAGLPQLILPCMLDQYYWANRAAEIGAGKAENGPEALLDPSFPSRIRALIEDDSIKEAANGLSRILSSPEREQALRARIAELFASG